MGMLNQVSRAIYIQACVTSILIFFVLSLCIGFTHRRFELADVYSKIKWGTVKGTVLKGYSKVTVIKLVELSMLTLFHRI